MFLKSKYIRAGTYIKDYIVLRFRAGGDTGDAFNEAVILTNGFFAFGNDGKNELVTSIRYGAITYGSS